MMAASDYSTYVKIFYQKQQLRFQQRGGVQKLRGLDFVLFNFMFLHLLFQPSIGGGRMGVLEAPQYAELINRPRVGLDQLMSLATPTQPARLTSVGDRWWSPQDLLSIVV